MALSKLVAGADVRKALSKRVVQLYSKMCRNAQVVITMYNLEHTPAEVRHMVLLQFRRHAGASDPRIIDMLIQRGEMELQEARNQWKQRGHLMAILQPEVPAADPLVDPEEFFRRFLDGSLDESTLWRGHVRSEQKRVMAALQERSAAGSLEAGEPWHVRAAAAMSTQRPLQ